MIQGRNFQSWMDLYSNYFPVIFQLFPIVFQLFPIILKQIRSMIQWSCFFWLLPMLQVPKSRRASAPEMSEASKRMPTYEKKVGKEMTKRISNDWEITQLGWIDIIELNWDKLGMGWMKDMKGPCNMVDTCRYWKPTELTKSLDPKLLQFWPVRPWL